MRHLCIIYFIGLLSVALHGQAQPNALPSVEDDLYARFREVQRLVGRHHDSAIMQGNALVALARANDNKRIEGLALHMMGVRQYFSGNQEEALQLYQNSLSVFESINDEANMVTVLNDMGRFHGKQPDYETAIELYDRALALSLKIGNEDQQANTLNNIGSIFYEQGEYHKALEYFEQSMRLKQKTNDLHGQAYNLDYIGSTLIELKRYDEAQKYLEEALRFRKQVKDKNALAINLNNLGELFVSKGEYQQAIDYFGEALVVANEIGYKDLRRHIYSQIARIYESKGDYRRALEYTNRFVALKDSLYNEQRSQQRLEMEQRYESEKKERALAQTQLIVEKRDNQLLLTGSALGIALLTALFIYRTQRSKQQQLLLNAELAEVKAAHALQHERLRISEELHDNIGSQLTFVNASIDAYDKSGTDNRLREIKKLTTSAIQELRKTVWLINKQSTTLEEFSVKLREYIPSEGVPPVSIEVTGDSQAPLPAQIATHLFRAIQELISNAARHANASRIDVRFSSDDGQFAIGVVDDGEGFDASAPSKGYGLRNVERRIRSLGGILSIQSQPGRTAVTASVPMNDFRH